LVARRELSRRNRRNPHSIVDAMIGGPMSRKMKKLPNEILVYQCDEIDGEPLYAVAMNVDDIPEDADGEKVGNYVLNRVSAFRVRRELK
jgi:hypothetical protein